MQVIRVISGDNELAALEFRKHYRLLMVHLMDSTRQFEKRYNRGGWPFLILTDGNGNIVYRANTLLDRDEQKITGLIEKMLEKKSALEPVTLDNTVYMPATVKRSGETEKPKLRRHFASVACGNDGKVYVVFTTNQNGNNDVYLRVFDGQKWLDDKPVAATGADEYDGQVIVDGQNRSWLCWTSNAEGNKYNIFAASPADMAEPIKPQRVTDADDDAMHGRLACDDSGRIWLTYYKWHKMGEDSRDKEIYLKRFENGKWGGEIRVSPSDVPTYEDHSDPAITADGDGVIVAWSWDYHRPKGYPQEPEKPSIFARRFSTQKGVSRPWPISGVDIDMTPVVKADKSGNLYFAWDSLRGGRGKVICAAVQRPGSQIQRQDIATAKVNVCTPCIAISPDGRVTLLWSQTHDGQDWILKRSDFDGRTNRWSEPETVVSDGNPRFLSAAYDGKGSLWLAYSVQTDKGMKAVAEVIEQPDRDR